MNLKLIAIEGADGVGKTTQIALLADYFQKKEVSVLRLHYPRTNSFWGLLVRDFLEGKMGGVKDVSPHLLSVVFAQDRAASRAMIQEHIEKGGIVLADRYTSSNIAHQAAKLKSEDQDAFAQWVRRLEYEELGVYREDLVVYLSVPIDTAATLSRSRGSQDIHEADDAYQQKVHAMYDELSRQKNWITISCIDSDGRLLDPETIHKKIVEKLGKYGI